MPEISALWTPIKALATFLTAGFQVSCQRLREEVGVWTQSLYGQLLAIDVTPDDYHPPRYSQFGRGSMDDEMAQQTTATQVRNTASYDHTPAHGPGSLGTDRLLRHSDHDDRVFVAATAAGAQPA